jgi:hypothetical protein
MSTQETQVRITRRFCIGVICFLNLFMGVAMGSEADAVAISQNIRARHMPFGIVVDPMFAAPESDEIVNYTHCGDSAIWTGHFLAAEAFRYGVTGSPDALDNVRAALGGIASLMNVTGTNLLARCLVPMNSPFAPAITREEVRHGIYSNTKDGYYWIGNTSRDQYSGVFFGLGVAYDLVDDAATRSAIKSLVTRLLDFLRGHNWFVVMPDGGVSTTFIGRADQQLSLLQVGRYVNADRFSGVYDVYRFFFAYHTVIPIAFEVLDDSSYFKFNLASINLFNLVRLERSSYVDTYREAYSVLWGHTSSHENAFFNMIDRGINGPSAHRDRETRRILEEWLWRPRRDVPVDLRGIYPTCWSEDRACAPIPIVERVRTDFLWQRSPFQLVGQSGGEIETAGIDYILPYWMARYYGVLE